MFILLILYPNLNEEESLEIKPSNNKNVEFSSSRKKITLPNNNFKNQPKDISNKMNSFLDDKSKTNFGNVNKNVNNNNKEMLLFLKKYYGALAYKKANTFEKFIKKIVGTPEILYNFNNLIESRKNIYEILSFKKGQDFIIQKARNEQQNKKLWMIAIKNYDIQLLKKLNTTGIKMSLSKNDLIQTVQSLENHPDITLFLEFYIEQKQKWLNVIKSKNIILLKKFISEVKKDKVELSNYELFNIILSFKSGDYYETFEILIDYIELKNEYVAHELIKSVFKTLKRPSNEKQQNSQLEITKKLMKFQSTGNWIRAHFYYVVYSLNVQLVKYVFNKINIHINDLFRGYSVLQWVVRYINTLNLKIEFAYKTFNYLLSVGADINKMDYKNNDGYFYINEIADQNIKQTFIRYVSEHT